MTRTIGFMVVGEEKIHCAGCEQRVTNALRRLPGIQDVRASFQTQRIAVAFDPSRTGSDQIKARLEQIGYEVIPQGDSG